MAKFFIVSTACRAVDSRRGLADSDAGERADSVAACTWLFSADPGVDDPETAIRTAVVSYFDSAEGQRVRTGEGLSFLGWEEAIPWVPDEIWLRHGLTAIRHPDVERLVLDSEEDLSEEISAPQSTPFEASTNAITAPSA